MEKSAKLVIYQYYIFQLRLYFNQKFGSSSLSMFGIVHYLNNLSLKSDHTSLLKGDKSTKGHVKHKTGMLDLASPWAKLTVWKNTACNFLLIISDCHCTGHCWRQNTWLNAFFISFDTCAFMLLWIHLF